MKNFIQLKRKDESEIFLINVDEIAAIEFTSYGSWIYMKNGETHVIFETQAELIDKIKRATGEIKS